MARNTWYSLDNVGKFYSSQAGSSAQTVFRFSATLVGEIDPGVLQRAVKKAVDTFPGFNVCLRSGMFWHYLEQADTPPTVIRENLPICYGLHVHAKSILFRVSHYRNRINFEVSHMVADGRGAMSFFKMLLLSYIQEFYGVEGVTPEYDGSDSQKAENSFDKYFERDKTFATDNEQGEAPPTAKPKVYRLTGWRDEADTTFMEYHLPTKRVRELARSYGVSMTSLVIAALMCAIRIEIPQREMNRTIRVDVPVDLRQVFDSATTKNFFGMTSVSYFPIAGEPVRDVAAKVDVQLKAATQAESLKPRMNRMIALEKNPVLRFAPMFVKDIALEIADYFAARETTTTVSNLGQIRLDEKLSPFVRDVNILTSTVGFNITFCSFGDDLSIGISTVFSNLDVAKNFCRYFSSEGIEGHININKTSDEIATDWRETKFETSVKRLGDQLSPANKSAEAGGEQDTSNENAEDPGKRPPSDAVRANAQEPQSENDTKGAVRQ